MKWILSPIVACFLFAATAYAEVTLSASQTTGNAPLQVTFTLPGDDGAEGTTVSYLWDFGDGNTCTDPGPVTHTYNEYGVYSASVSVTDDQGVSTQGSVQISVSAISWGEDQYQFWYGVDANGGMTADGATSLSNPYATGPIGVRTNMVDWNDPITSAFASHYEDPLVDLVLDAGASGGLSDLGAFARAYAAAELNLAGSQSFFVEQRTVSFVARGFTVPGPAYYDLVATLDGVIEFNGSGTQTSNPHAIQRMEGGVVLLEYALTGSRPKALREWDVSLADLIADRRRLRNVWLRPSHKGSPVGYTLLLGFSSLASDILDFDWQGFYQGILQGSTGILASGTYQLGNVDDPLEVAASFIPGSPANQPPIVEEIQASRAVGHVPLGVSFTCVASDPPDGTVVSFVWDLGDGTISKDQYPSHVYTSPGAYTVTLTVTDDVGATAQRALTVFATPPNEPPTSEIAAPVTEGKAPLEVTLALDAQDSDGRIVSYEWDFGDGFTDTGPGPKTHIYETAGVYHVKVTAVDDDGDTTVVAMEISAHNPPPPLPPPVVPSPSTSPPVTPPPAPAEPSSPARSQVGLNPGVRTYYLPADQVFDLMVNITNRAGEQPVHEWFAFTATMGKSATPVYLLKANGAVPLLPGLDIYTATYPFDHSSEAVTICTLALGDLGLVAGDQLIYAYVYVNFSGEMVIENIVTINVL
jgi:PKD repeat protein